MAKSSPEFSQLEFAWNVHAYTNDYIRFADTKAAFYVAICGGLLACLYALKAHALLSLYTIDLKHFSLWITFVSSVSCLAHIGLLLCCLFSAWAVVPRLWKEFLTPWQRAKKQVNEVLNDTPPKTGLIFFNEVTNYKEKEDYAKVVAEATLDVALEAVTSHVHALAGVCYAKYYWLNIAWLPGAFGAGMTFLFIALTSK
jgi:hypothetical protein